jgi:GntR family transcriptional regulator, transcriptional repressor for pyruvate dehydrogenase complex
LTTSPGADPEDRRARVGEHIQPTHRPTISDKITRRLISLIVDEGFQPGTKLPPERDLMARLDVGRSSLREAIRGLRAIGVLEVSIGQGTYVSNGGTSILTQPLSWGLFLSEQNVHQVVEARQIVEVELTGWAAERATEDELAAIGELRNEMVASANNRETYIALDLEFHLAVARAGHNDIFYHVLHSLQPILRDWMERAYADDAGRPRSLTSHAEIHEALGARDQQTAMRAMRSHLEGSRLVSWLAKGSTADRT